MRKILPLMLIALLSTQIAAETLKGPKASGETTYDGTHYYLYNDENNALVLANYALLQEYKEALEQTYYLLATETTRSRELTEQLQQSRKETRTAWGVFGASVTAGALVCLLVSFLQ